MSQIRLMLFPSFVKDALDAKVITNEQLEDITHLKGIFSDAGVSKILYLNNITKHNASVTDKQVLAALGYDWLLDEAPTFPNTTGVRTLTTDFLTALQHDGDELLAKVVAKSIHRLAVAYDVVRIRNNTYGLVFKPFITINCVAERKNVNAIHMKHLLRQGIVDNAVTMSVPYAQYVNSL